MSSNLNETSPVPEETTTSFRIPVTLHRTLLPDEPKTCIPKVRAKVFGRPPPKYNTDVLASKNGGNYIVEPKGKENGDIGGISTYLCDDGYNHSWVVVDNQREWDDKRSKIEKENTEINRYFCYKLNRGENLSNKYGLQIDDEITPERPESKHYTIYPREQIKLNKVKDKGRTTGYFPDIDTSKWVPCCVLYACDRETYDWIKGAGSKPEPDNYGDDESYVVVHALSYWSDLYPNADDYKIIWNIEQRLKTYKKVNIRTWNTYEKEILFLALKNYDPNDHYPALYKLKDKLEKQQAKLESRKKKVQKYESIPTKFQLAVKTPRDSYDFVRNYVSKATHIPLSNLPRPLIIGASFIYIFGFKNTIGNISFPNDSNIESYGYCDSSQVLPIKVQSDIISMCKIKNDESFIQLITAKCEKFIKTGCVFLPKEYHSDTIDMMKDLVYDLPEIEDIVTIYFYVFTNGVCRYGTTY
ncbi:hypothetical protein HDV04_003926 [Boothiomyces sp. JEL0838]|nr:hypothetical protein HDV04_003926 [Boothiomyces sp. JEL0838]